MKKQIQMLLILFAFAAGDKTFINIYKQLLLRHAANQSNQHLIAKNISASQKKMRKTINLQNEIPKRRHPSEQK